MAIDIIISDLSLTGHPETVRSAINYGYGSNITDRILIANESLSASLERANNIGAKCVVRSTTGLSSYINMINQYYITHGIQTFMPLGSNSHVYIGEPSGINHGCIASGAGDGINETAYGPALEFFDTDNDGNPDVDASSYANGVIAGKLLKIKDTANCTWWQARYAARATASESGIWDSNDGYGIINVSAAVSYLSGNTVPDEDPSGPLDDPPIVPQAGYLKLKGGNIETKPTLVDREMWVDKTNKRLVVKIDNDEYYVSLTLIA